MSSQFLVSVTRINGDPSWNRNLENTWDWTAVNTPVELAKGNVNAVHINRKNYNNRKDQGVASHKMLWLNLLR